MSLPTISLSDARKEYLVKFIDWRKKWFAFEKDGHTPGEIQYAERQTKKYAALLDLNTRLQNEMKGRTR